jgi:hypothetical protein
MSPKYITSRKNFKTGADELEDGSVWGKWQNFISLGASKGHNPALIISNVLCIISI